MKPPTMFVLWTVTSVVVCLISLAARENPIALVVTWASLASFFASLAALKGWHIKNRGPQ